MNILELKTKLEKQGYEVKSVRVFSNSFHVNVWTPEMKLQNFYNVPLSSIEWTEIKKHFPPIKKVKV